MSTKNALIIYCNVPESTDLFLVKLTNEEMIRAMRCHNKYINMVGCEDVAEDMDWLSDFLAAQPKKSKVAKKHPHQTIEGIDVVILTGFLS